MGKPRDSTSDRVRGYPSDTITVPLTGKQLAAYASLSGTSNRSFIVEIMSGGAVGAATFRYSTDGGVTFDDNGGAGYLTATGGTLLEDGVSIAFSDSGTLTAEDRSDEALVLGRSILHRPRES